MMQQRDVLLAAPGVAPQQQMMVPLPAVQMPFSPVSSVAFDVLASLPRVQIRQQRQIVEALTGFERNNRYIIRDEGGRDIFFCKENSHCYERNCCHGACKPWRMDVFIIARGGAGAEDMIPFLHMERPCTCTCLCLNRPEVFLSDLSTGASLGSITEPFAFCDLVFGLKDAMGNQVLDSTGKCCQMGLMCPCPCEGCPGKEVSFPVTDSTSSLLVGTVTKVWMMGDCCPLCFKEWDNYWVHFGAVQDPRWKMMLIALAIFVQMRFFDRRDQK